MAKIINSLISRFVGLKQDLTEPAMLGRARRMHEADYRDGGQDPLISLIIATYSRGRILAERTIPSILNQTYPNFEIIIVGDHCIDDTRERLGRIKDERIVFFDLPRRGKYPVNPSDRWFVQGIVPRNKGLEIARGQWFCWISDDDLLLPEHFDSLLRFAQSGHYEFVSASYSYMKDGEIQVQNASAFHPRIGGMQTWMYRSYLRCFKWNIHSWRKSWNRPCDYDLQDRMVRAGVRMGFMDKVVAHIPPVEGTNDIGLKAHMALAEVST